jgi:hypothetical protein
MEITPGQRLDLLSEIKTLLPDAEFSVEESFRGKDIVFQDGCGCYSDYTTEPCSFEVCLSGTLPISQEDQYTLNQAIRSKVNRWVESSLTWSGCECCDNEISVWTRIYQKKV